jgi:2,4-diaminopentanoate dehydrogenase
VDLVTYFGIFDLADGIPLGDTLRLEGEEPIEICAPLGYESFLSTVAIFARNAPLVAVAAEPGLRTMSDPPVVELSSKGTRLTRQPAAPEPRSQRQAGALHDHLTWQQ